MTSASTETEIRRRLRAALEAAYGERLDRVVLYGSRARRQAHPDSDYDVAVFLRDMSDRAAELKRVADIGVDILYDTGEFIHLLPYPAAAYSDPRMPLMHEIRREGVPL
jgi:predicted nucleotidyltransferase